MNTRPDHRRSIAMVSYKNTLPFLYGFKHKDGAEAAFDLSLYNPALCAKAYLDGKVDISLVPAAFLQSVPGAKVITDYCIAADGPVNSVCLLSNTPIHNITQVILDDHSITSNALVKILCRELWEIAPNYTKKDVSLGYNLTDKSSGVVMIGDKVFEFESQFRYKYDLAEHWKKMTNLPFVFAVWIANESVPQESIDQLNAILTLGVNNIDTIVEDLSNQGLDYETYLKFNLKYNFTDEYKQGLKMYLDLIPQMSPTH